MQKNRKNLFQILLLILALVFVITVRYICNTTTTQAGAFSGEETFSSVTLSDAFEKIYESEAKN